MKTIDVLVTVTYDDDVLKDPYVVLGAMPLLKDAIGRWGMGYVTYAHAREIKGIRD